MSDLLNSASLVMIPSGYAEDKVYSAVPTDGSGDLSFTRASNGTRVNSAGLVEVCPWNLASDSNSFGGLSAITKTSGQPSPIDSTSGSLLTATGSGEHYSGIASLTATVGTPYTFSVFGKFVQGVQLALRTVFSNGDEDISTIWNLSTGALVANAGNHTNPTITAVGNGYYRCSITYTPSAVPAFPLLFRLQMAVGGALSFTASSGDGFLAYGAQINNGALKPYFPTTDRLNVPRLTYQNGGGGCPSLLLEKQSTNLTLYSEQFDNTWWLKFNATISANATTSPDGTQNADKLIATTDNSGHAAYKQTLIASGSATISIFAKAGGYNFLRIGNTLALDKTAYFNLSNGTLGTVGANATASILNMGNGWYQCVVTFTATSGSGIGIDLASANDTPSFIGDGTSGVFIWGAQLEASSYPTSYIPTTSASATRVADACYKTGIGSLFGSSYTLFGQFINLGINNTRLLTVKIPSAGNYDNFITIYQSGTGLIATGNNASSVEQFNIGSGTYSIGQTLKFALRCVNNDVAFYINGTQIGTDTSATIPAVTAIYVGNYVDVIESSLVNQVVIFNSGLTNTQLAQLTA